ncbi:MAG TPA: hypothetical protein VMJ10_12190 [Kofleriaceae bacterium]|nr:hypothetical protein [Kofleriaceae bacterium]
MAAVPVAPVMAPVPVGADAEAAAHDLATDVTTPYAGVTKGYVPELWSFRPGGFLQPQFRENQYSPTSGYQDGFRFARARFTGVATGRAGNLELSAYYEAELQPTFSLYDAYLTVKRPLPNDQYVMVDLGQTRVPIGRQNMLSDTRLSFVDKPQIGYPTIAPDRDLGTRVWYKAPRWVRVYGGVFNGEGRDQPQNINDSYLYAGRVEITPIGREMPFAESYFDGDWLTIGTSIGHNKLDALVTNHQLQLYDGFDISGAWHGLSGSFEYEEVRNTYDGNTATRPPAYNANGFVAQIAYMLPQRLPPFGESRLELGARVEEYDRNDAIPITMPGDPNQSEREWTACISYYLRKHTLKAQLAANHYQQIENKTVTGANATYGHDQLLLQVTYRVE